MSHCSSPFGAAPQTATPSHSQKVLQEKAVWLKHTHTTHKLHSRSLCGAGLPIEQSTHKEGFLWSIFGPTDSGSFHVAVTQTRTHTRTRAHSRQSEMRISRQLCLVFHAFEILLPKFKQNYQQLSNFKIKNHLKCVGVLLFSLYSFCPYSIPNILPIFRSLPSDSGVAALHSCIFKITWKDLLQIIHLAFLPKPSFLSFHLKLVVPSMRFWWDFNLTTTLPPFDGQCCYQSGRAVRVVRTAPPLVNQSNGELGQAQFLEREQGHVTWLHSGERMGETKVTNDGNEGEWRKGRLCGLKQLLSVTWD